MPVKKVPAFEPHMRLSKSKHGFNVGWFYDPTYRANIDLIWPVTSEKISAYMKDRFGKEYARGDDFGASTIEYWDKGHQHNIICLREWGKKPDEHDYSFLAHEAFHCAEHILSARGVKLVTQVATEPYAYLLESIMRRCLYLLNS